MENVIKTLSGVSAVLICARCKRRFTPKKEGEKYGPKCARKLAGQVQLDSMALISGKVLKA